MDNLHERKTLVVISGIAGSGKTTAVHELEDLGYYCIDNLPAALLLSFAEALEKGAIEFSHICLGLDSRDPAMPIAFQTAYHKLIANAHVKILYLKASEETVLRRFRETRRHHPLCNASSPLLSLQDAVRLDIKVLEPIEKLASQILDTTHMPVHHLKRLIHNYFATTHMSSHLLLNLVSFGFKYGTPTDLDTIFDVRCFKNPYYKSHLRELTGQDTLVKDYVFSDENIPIFIERVVKLIEFLYPLYTEEGKRYFSLGIGCTGGKHRSVAIVEELVGIFHKSFPLVTREHRHIDKE